MDQALQQTQDRQVLPIYDIEQGGLRFQQQMLFNCIASKQQSGLSKQATSMVETREGFIPWDHGEAALTAITGGGHIIVDAINLSQKTNLMAVAVAKTSINTLWLLTVTSAGVWVNIGSVVNYASTDLIHLSEFTNRTVAPSAPSTTTPVVCMVQEKIAAGASKIYYSTTFGAASLIDLTATAAAPWNASWSGFTWCGPVKELNGRAYIASKNGYIMGSELGSISTWLETNFLPTDAYPDSMVGLCRFKHLLLAFGTESVEFYTDIGNSTGSVLQRTDQAFVHFGAVNSKAFINVDDVVFWISKSASGTYQLWKMDGYVPVPVSNSGFDIVFENTVAQANVPQLHVCTLNGKRNLFTHLRVTSTVLYQYMSPLIGPGNSTCDLGVGHWRGPNYTAWSWVYNITDDTWWCFSLGNTSTTRVFYPVTPNYDGAFTAIQSYVFFNNGWTAQIQGDPTSCSTGDVNSTALTAESYPVAFSTNPTRFNTSTKKFAKRFTVLLDGTTDLHEYVFTYSDNSGSTAGSKAGTRSQNWVAVTPATGAILPALNFRRLGAFRRRYWQLGFLCLAYQRFDGIEIELTQGVS